MRRHVLAMLTLIIVAGCGGETGDTIGEWFGATDKPQKAPVFSKRRAKTSSRGRRRLAERRSQRNGRTTLARISATGQRSRLTFTLRSSKVNTQSLPIISGAAPSSGFLCVFGHLEDKLHQRDWSHRR